MTQVIFIHGGTTFFSYESFLENLRTKTVMKERLLGGVDFWMQRLGESLGPEYEIIAPSMPNKQNAQYGEWSLWFSRVAEIAEDDCILIGHSMGGIFLPKYLNEHVFPKKIKACILVAAPYNDETVEDLTDFKIPSEGSDALGAFSRQVDEIVFFHGSDDPVISMEDAGRYKTALPEAEYHTLPAPDHFMRRDFPELIARIRALKN